MTYEHLLVEKRGRVAWLYLNRPEKLNAMSTHTMNELRDALRELRADKETRVIVFSGKGRAFCSGADLESKPDPNAPPSDEPTFLDAAQGMEDELNAMPKPVIAALNGLTCGGGLELTMMCDLVIAAEGIKIGDAHSNVGMLPGGGSSVRLPRVVGINRARYIMYSGDFFSASEMREFGLVNKVVSPEMLESEVQALADKLAAKSPLGLKRMKQLINDSYDLPTPNALRAEKMVVKDHLHSFDAYEGGAAFAEKRKPEFKGY